MSLNTKPITIAIVEDHPIVIEGLRKILNNVEQVKSVLEFHGGTEFIRYLKEDTLIDLVLLDITLPDSNGVDVCREIKERYPNVKVIGFSNHSDRSLVLQLLAHGASGYLLKNASSVEIIQSITDAMNGQITFSDQVKQIMIRPPATELRKIPPLTKREKQVLSRVADGKTSVEIATELSVSPLTVETHRRNLMQKLDVKNVAGLIKVATEMKLL